MKFDWKTASLDDMEKFIGAARLMAQQHPHSQVRMFVFQLCKGIEQFIRKERRSQRDAPQHKEESRVRRQDSLRV